MRSPMLHCPESLFRDRGLRVAWRGPGRLAFNCSPATRALGLATIAWPDCGDSPGNSDLAGHRRDDALADVSRPAPWEMCGESEVGLSDRGPNVRASIA